MSVILFVVGSLGGGGAERVISILSSSLSLNNHEVHILALAHAEKAYSFDENVIIHTLNNENKFSILLRPRKIRALVSSIEPNVVLSFVDQVSMQVCLGFSRLKKKPFLVLCERNDPFNDPSNPLVRTIRNHLFRRGDAFVFQTDEQREYFSRQLREKPFLIVRNPIVDGLPKYEGFNSNYFVAVGRLTEQKNYPVLIRAFKKIVEKGYRYKLLIFGNGPLLGRLNSLIAKQRLQQTVSIQPFNKDIHYIMARAKGYLLSSDFEGVSNSMLEALAIGVPVVTTDYPSGGARMYVGHDAGHLVSCQDVDGFAKAIEDIIIDDEAAVNMAKRGIEKVSNHSAAAVSKLWESFILDLLAAQNG